MTRVVVTVIGTSAATPLRIRGRRAQTHKALLSGSTTATPGWMGWMNDSGGLLHGSVIVLLLRNCNDICGSVAGQVQEKPH